MATIKDIAKIANVSTATVSYVLNGNGNISKETREKVLRIIEELNYKPNNIAKSLKINKSDTIGVIVEDITVFSSPEIIDGINEYAEKYGLSIILTNLRVHKKIGHNFLDIGKYKPIIAEAVEDLLSKQVDGIIYVGVHTRDVTGLIDMYKPIVYGYCYTTNESEHSVNCDDELAGFEATDHLIQLGHEKIALISGLIDSIPAQERLKGYNKAMKQKGLPIHRNYMKSGNWEYESGFEMAMELLQLEDKPTAIVAMNDLMAIGALDASKQLGMKVPAELSVIGFDNRESGMYYTPKLTTMGPPLREMGNQCMQNIYDLLMDKHVSGHEAKLKCSLIKRKSTYTPTNNTIHY